MRRCVLFLAWACVAALGQEQPATPSLNLNRATSVENAVRNLFRMNAEPRGVMRFKPAPGGLMLLEAAPRERTCVVPLLEVPVNPKVDRKIIVPLPQSNPDHMPIVQGLPACSSNRLK
jgi:hypothetical protein